MPPSVKYLDFKTETDAQLGSCEHWGYLSSKPTQNSHRISGEIRMYRELLQRNVAAQKRVCPARSSSESSDDK
jgi:hypothetical protein